MPRLINYPHVASMVFGVPLFATPALVTAVKSVLEPRLLGKDVDSVEPVAPLALIDDEVTLSPCLSNSGQNLICLIPRQHQP